MKTRRKIVKSSYDRRAHRVWLVWCVRSWMEVHPCADCRAYLPWNAMRFDLDAIDTPMQIARSGKSFEKAQVRMQWAVKNEKLVCANCYESRKYGNDPNMEVTRRDLRPLSWKPPIVRQLDGGDKPQGCGLKKKIVSASPGSEAGDKETQATGVGHKPQGYGGDELSDKSSLSDKDAWAKIRKYISGGWN